MGVDLSFWRGRRVFITGHTGFKGSWLVAMLLRLGARVSGYALRPETTPNMFDLLANADRMTSIEGDVRDGASLDAAMRNQNPEIVFHLAAQSLVRRSYADPVGTYETNVMGTVRLLEAVRRTPSVTACLVVTSDKCYENREWMWGYRENEPLGGHDPYSSSKGCTELVAAAYRRSYFNESSPLVATARAGNVIGGGDWAEDRLIPDLIRAFDAGMEAEIRYPAAVRPWQHVLEPLSGYLMLAERLAAGDRVFCDGWNFGPSPDDARQVSWIADTLVESWGAPAAWRVNGQPVPHEAHHLRLDSTKARTILGWTPKLTLPVALEWLVEWYKAARAGADMREITNVQIDRYFSASR